ncbi:MAG TPA: DUF4350 domain-containing protein, partial [Candidatus Sulfotelmatobacter sp.]|nr:DUF4350 domain-containing protein [Candidatus Sulfotelmatobacter sp.]
IFAGKYPRAAKRSEREGIPPAYATELQTVMNALNDLNQARVDWDCGTRGLGVLVSDSLMFERGEPVPSDRHLSHIYGLALPLLKRGMPVTPVQLENLTVSNYLAGFRVLLLTYQGMKPLSPEVHAPLADWVKRGGALVVVDDDSDPFNGVREWWNSADRKYATPRTHLFEQLGLKDQSFGPELKPVKVNKGQVIWLRENPARLAATVEGDARLLASVQQAAQSIRLQWHEANHLVLRRGPYVIAAGLEESIPGEPKQLRGHFINLFDPELRVRDNVSLAPGSRFFLLDLDAVRGKEPKVLASACKALPVKSDTKGLTFMVEGVPETPAVVLLRTAKAPQSVRLGGEPLSSFEYADQLLWIRFPNKAEPRELQLSF